MEIYSSLVIIVLIVVQILLLLFKKQQAGFDTTSFNERLIRFEAELASIKENVASSAATGRQEIAENNKIILETLLANLKRADDSMRSGFDTFSARISDFSASLNTNFMTFREIIENSNFNSRNEINSSFKTFEEKFSSSTAKSLKEIAEVLQSSIALLSTENAGKLEQMRIVVEEKLQSTLERRLGESFRLVSDRLEKVQQGLGEMQNLATGVGDLKKVLSNVKNRGMIGEYQLENILAQILSPEQYVKNAHINNSSKVVEFAVKLPGRLSNSAVLLPIDSKFPIESYQSLLDAYDSADTITIETNRKKLLSSIKSFAKDISDKYLQPPFTTDFAVMFLPVEGLYAEVLRNAGLFEQLQTEYKIIVAGPTTLSALLNSLSMGFKTLAIEKRSSEVWEVLSGVKSEFNKFEEILEKAKSKIFQAGDEIEKLVGTRTRAISRKLKDVEITDYTSGSEHYLKGD